MSKYLIVDKIEKLNDNMTMFHDLLGNEINSLKSEFQIETPGKLEQAISIIENKNRLLKIGIVGRVKAGKSSLINALLFSGENVLPKAATPMTASLTILSYSETMSAEVEFFSKEDISNIKNEHDEYEKIFSSKKEIKINEIKERKKNRNRKKLDSKEDVDIETNETNETNEINEINEKACKQVSREMKEYLRLSASYDQYTKMKESDVFSSDFKSLEKIKVNNIKELSDSLVEYVSAKGKYMPFTKSVHIKLPQDNLKDIEIIDTPGLNDPVQSREERTRELLKFCDVVLIVSPSGQFLNKSDLELMDRITMKEGIRELYVVSTQVDTQLFGSEKGKNNGNLPKVLESITNILGKQLSSTLEQLKKNNPEIGSVFDKLISQGKEHVIHSSGICETIKLSFDNMENWDDGVKTVWDNLKSNYKDYFTENDKMLTISNLDLLSNVGAIRNIINDVRKKKEKILKDRKNDFIKAKTNSLEKYTDGIIFYAKNQIEIINSTSIEEANEKKDKLINIKKVASINVNLKYEEEIDDFAIKIKRNINNTINKYYKKTKNEIMESKGTEIESYRVEKSGIGNWFARMFTSKGYENRTRTITTVRTGSVVNAINEFKYGLEQELIDTFREEVNDWKKSLPKNIVSELRKYVKDDDLEPSLIKRSIRNILNSIVSSVIVYDNDNLKANGILENNEAIVFMEKADKYLYDLKKHIMTTNENNIEKILDSKKNYDVAAEIFDEYEEKIIELQEQIKSKKITVERYNKLIKSVMEVV